MTALLPAVLAYAVAGSEGWPHWRGPNDDGMGDGDAPLDWSDSEHIAWKAAVPDHGNSSPVVWGDRIFVTTAVPTGKAPATSEVTAPPPGPPASASGGGPGRRGPDVSGPPQEQKFILFCYDRNTGKLLWEKVARMATPHEGYHAQYGSFASNSPVSDGKELM